MPILQWDERVLREGALVPRTRTFLYSMQGGRYCSSTLKECSLHGKGIKSQRLMNAWFELVENSWSKVAYTRL